MKKISSFLLLLLVAVMSFGQINMADSTVQVICYWDKLEKQTYLITNESYKIRGADTTARKFSSYEVDVTIIDSTENTYTIEWLYKNVKPDAADSVMLRIAKLSEGMRVVITTDELGVFKGVENWEEIRDSIASALVVLKAEYGALPNLDAVINHVKNLYSSKAAIEGGAVKDISQFYTFHGLKYGLGEELTGQIQLANLYGGEPFDTDVSILLDEINADDDNAVFRMWQNVNTQQLTDATYGYLKDMAAATKSPIPPRNKFPEVSNEIRTAARIHGPSGWIIYSIETREVMAEDSMNVEERIIEIL